MFNFNQARVRCSKIGVKVHVCKALLGMKENPARVGAELDVLSKAVDYIKALEAEVSRLEAGAPVIINGPVTFHAQAEFDDADPKGFTSTIIETFGRGPLGRLFGGNQ